MHPVSSSIPNEALVHFHRSNPGERLLHFDFFDPQRVSSIHSGAEGAETPTGQKLVDTLMAYQRLLRIGADEETATILLSKGFGSARQICALGKRAFIQATRDALSGGSRQAANIYGKANAVKTQTMHLWTNVNHLRKSPHFMGMRAAAGLAQVVDRFENLSSYQQLFGSLDYCDCPECKSILGPAAYLTDLLRLIDKAITQANQGSIPAGLSFNERRPDIARLKLDCSNTNDLVPYLEIVNEILEQKLEAQLDVTDIYRAITSLYYPFNLPFDLNLQQIRACLVQGGSCLADVYAAMTQLGGIKHDITWASEWLGISPEELAHYYKPVAGDQAAILSANYGMTLAPGDTGGLNVVDAFLAQVGISYDDLLDLLTQGMGPEEIFNVSGEYTVTGTPGTTITLIQGSNKVSGSCPSADGKTVLSIQGSLLGTTVQGSWQQAAPGDKTAGTFSFSFGADVSSFTGQLFDPNGKATGLVIQGTRTGDPSTGGIVPHNLFINNVLPDASGFMSIQEQPPGNGEQQVIANLTPDTLDTLNRYIRISRKLGYSFASADWALLAANRGNPTRELADYTVIRLAEIKKLQVEYKLSPDLLNVLWYDLQTTGTSTGKYSTAPFDLLFNSSIPSTAAPTDFYRPKPEPSDSCFVSPLYVQQPATWSLKDSGTTANDAGQLIVSGIPAPLKSIRLIAAAAFGALEPIPLTVNNLSILYRHCMLAKTLLLHPEEYITLLRLLGLAGVQGILVPVFTPSQVLQVTGALSWMRKAGINAFASDFICNGNISPYMVKGYKGSDITFFLASLNQTMAKLLLSPASFSGNGISAADSLAVFEWLITRDYVLVSGLVSMNATLDTGSLAGSGLSLTAGQQDNIVQVVGDYCQSQQNLFANSLGAFLGVKADLAEAVTTQVATLFNCPDYLSFFIGFSTFSVDSSVFLMPGWKPDPTRVREAFLVQGARLSAGFSVQYLDGIGAWMVADTSNNRLYWGIPLSRAIQFSTQSDGTVSPGSDQASSLVDALTRYLLFAQTLQLTTVDVASVTKNAAGFSQDYPKPLDIQNFIVTFPLDNIKHLFAYKSLAAAFGDKKQSLAAYFTAPASAALADITGWGADQVSFLCKTLFPNDGDGCSTIVQVNQLNELFSIAAKAGTDVYLLAELNQMRGIAPAASGTDAKNYADALLQNMRSGVSAIAWGSLLKKINQFVNEARRDALLPLSIWQARQTSAGPVFHDIKTPNALYEFLMIDVERSGCETISYVKQALNSAQLYLQRCRLNLEEGVTIDVGSLPDAYWEWILNYRVWEANREVFLYPENYIDPSLRSSKTDLFRTLERSLSQGAIDKDSAESAFRNYMKGFAQMASLVYVDAYQYATGTPEETLYLFARTHTRPYKYYYISYQPSAGWSPWNDINISINADTVTGMFGFGKLYLFWVEQTVKKENLPGSTNNSQITITTAAIKGSWYDFNGNWSAPQAIGPDQVIEVDGDNFFVDTNNPRVPAPFFSRFDASQSYNRKLMAIPVNNDNFSPPSARPEAQEKIILFFGPIVSQLDLSDESKNCFPSPTAVPGVKEFETAVSNDWNTLAAPTFGSANYLALSQCLVIDPDGQLSSLINNGEQLVLTSDTVPTDAGSLITGFFVVAANNTLYIDAIANSVWNNYTEGMGQEGVLYSNPQTAEYAVFIPLLNDQDAQNLCDTLQASGYLDQNFWVVRASVDQLTIAYLTSTFNYIGTQAIAQQIRQILYTCCYGTRVLLDTIPSGPSGIIPVHNQPGSFIFFAGSEFYLFRYDGYPDLASSSMQIASTVEGQTTINYVLAALDPDFTIYDIDFQVERLDTGAVKNLNRSLFSGGMDALLSLAAQQTPPNAGGYFQQLSPGMRIKTPSAVAFEVDNQVRFIGPYANYFWELFFHAPMLVAQKLTLNQQYSDAEKWLQYIFNPTTPLTAISPTAFVSNTITEAQSAAIIIFLTTPTNGLMDATGDFLKDFPGTLAALSRQFSTLAGLQLIDLAGMLSNVYQSTPLTRYWRFRPFRNHTLESLVCQLTNPSEIQAYATDPFDPHAIARLRIGAYEKAIVLQYVSNLIQWGDQEFRQYTWESITSALMYYTYAADLLGPRPADLGPCPQEFPVSFQDIQEHYAQANTPIPEFLIVMENALTLCPLNAPPSGNGSQPFNDIETLFCVPENQSLTSYWDTIDNRMYNIRHCLNIDGVPQPLPLFEPPLNPMDLVRAAAAGGNNLNVGSFRRPDILPYRFPYLANLAKELCSTVITLGANLLQALEKGDAEGLALLQSANELNILSMTTISRQADISDLNNQLAGLQQNMMGAQYRQQYYQSLISDGLNIFETGDLILRLASMIPMAIAADLHGVAIPASLVPNIYGLADGGMNFGGAIAEAAQMTSSVAEVVNQQAGLLATAGNYARRAQEWQFEEQAAGYDVAQISAQAEATQARLDAATQDLAIHLATITQAQAVDQFLRSKFSSQDLYQWTSSRLAGLYFQAYQLALDMALKAQAAYQFELDTDNQLIGLSYWDNLYKGLLAGESLLLSVQQLESAYTQTNTRRLEIEKTVSIASACPGAIDTLKKALNQGPASLKFSFAEALFDMDYPGHYCRKIKSVSVSIPVVIGPYENINVSLLQTSNQTLVTADIDAVTWMLTGNGSQPEASVLRQDWLPNQAVALSGGIDDSGMFVLDFNDERFLPFEGTGAVSDWSLDFPGPPQNSNRSKYSSLSDVIIRIRYTAKNGGSDFASQVSGLLAGSGAVTVCKEQQTGNAVSGNPPIFHKK